MKFTRRSLFLLSPLLLPLTLVVIRQGQHAWPSQAEAKKLQFYVQSGTFTSKGPASLTELPIQFELPQSVISITTVPRYSPEISPKEAIDLPIKITNHSNRDLVLMEDADQQTSSGFYKESTLLPGSPLCGVSESDTRLPHRFITNRGVIVFNHTHIIRYKVSPLSQQKDIRVLPAKSAVTLDIHLNYELKNSRGTEVSPFVKNPGNHRMQVALVFKADGERQYAMSHPLLFTVKP